MTTQTARIHVPIRRSARQPGVGTPALVVLMATSFAMATAYGMLLLLPLYVQALGGDEAQAGLILSSAVVAAVLSLVTLARFPEVVRPHWVLAGSIGIFGIGSAGAAAVDGGWKPLVGVGVLLGTGWAVFYTSAPMTVSAMVTDSGRATYFGFLSGCQQLGLGAGPVLAGILVETGVGFRGTFATAAAISALAVVGAVLVGVLTPDARTMGAPGRGGVQPGLAEASRLILRSQTAAWLGLIVLFACLFTSVTQFQPTFAAARDLDYSVFYVSYTLAVIFARFAVAPWTAGFEATVVIAVSVSAMTLAVGAFLVVGSDPVAYALASVLLGMTYGLALPAVQAQAVNSAPDAARPRVLPLAGLVFQTAILGFPVVVGWLVVTFGYWMLFTVLLAFAVLQAWISWRHVPRRRRPHRRRPGHGRPRAGLAWSARTRADGGATAVKVTG